MSSEQDRLYAESNNIKINTKSNGSTSGGIENVKENDQLAERQTELDKKEHWTRLLTLVGYATTLGSAVPVGYCIGVINNPSKQIKAWCNETLIQKYDVQLSDSGIDILWSLIVSIFLIGGAVGSLGGASAANKFGRKGCLFIITGLFTLGAFLFFFCRLAGSVEMLLLGRLLVGLASGLTTATLPMYLTEIAPLTMRGTLGVFCAVGVTGGVVVGQVFSLSRIFGIDNQWNYALSYYIVLVFVCYLPAYFFPESPKYLFIVRGEYEKARNELRRLRGTDSNAMEIINRELEEMDFEANLKSQSSKFFDVLRDPALFLPLLIVCCFHGGQQLSGINAIFYYSVSIFEKAGFSRSDAEAANLGCGILNLATSFLGPILMAKIDRRPLMMFSSLVCACFLFAIAFIFDNIDTADWLPVACIVCVLGYIFFYQFGLGPIPYFIGSELFEVAPRPVAMAMGSLASWTCNFIIGIAFPTMLNAFGAFVFIPFGVTCLLVFLLTKFYLPETRKRDPIDIAPLVAKGFRSKVK